MLAGFGQAGGSLHLGPFSVGVQAQVKFLVSGADTYLWAEVTGRISLLFCHIKATIPISFGHELPALTLPPPDRHPIDRVDAHSNRTGSLGVLADDRYYKIAELAEDPAQAPTAWPDAIISLPFAVAPDINPAVAGGQFPGAAGPGATPAPAMLGAEMLHYNWRLDSITLCDVTLETDKVNGPGVQPAGQLAARWQVPRSGAGGSDVNELNLFSTGPDLWVNRLADAGASLPGGDPLGQAPNICDASPPAPVPGWAVGFLATTDVPGFRLPPDPVSADPRVCRVEAHVHHAGLIRGPGGLQPVSLDTILALPEPYAIDPAALVAWPEPLAIGRPFAGHLVAPSLRWLPGQVPTGREPGSYLGQQLRLDLTEPIVGGELVIVTDRAAGQDAASGVVAVVTVADDQGAPWAITQPVPVPSGDVAFVYTAPADHQVSSLTVTFPLGAPVGVIGLSGVTASSAAAAALERTMVEQEADRRAAAASWLPPSPGTYTPHQRAILDPGRLYRIDVGMTWKGTISKQNEAGQIVPAATKNYGDPGTTTYANGQPATKHLFFQTAKDGAPAPPPAPAPDALPPGLARPQTTFQPEMLERYLGGYEPGQGEEFWFCDDPLRAHFQQDHVVALARAYGYQLEVAVRRVDRPGKNYATPNSFPPAWSYSTNPAFLTGTDQIRYADAAASRCPGPKPGATGTVSTGLEPQALYELYVQARPGGTGQADRALPGMTFRTSRWRCSADMFSGLGCTSLAQAPPTVIIGDLAVTLPDSAASSSVLDDDQAFDNALAALNITGWPAADGPRLSRLWMTDPAGGWLFCGLVIESPEPIHRAGRLELTGLQAQTDTGQPVAFGFTRRDRIGARLLYLTRNPVHVATADELALRAALAHTAPPEHGDDPVLIPPSAVTDVIPALTLLGTEITSATATPVAVSIGLPDQPSFAGDP